MDNIFHDLGETVRRGIPALLATVVRVYGSAYRHEGAAAVLTADGVAAGAISGGCLEQDLLAIAADIIAGATPRLLDYDTSADEDLIWGTGSGCGGQVQILMATVPGPVLTVMEQAAANGQAAVLCTVLTGAGIGERLAAAAGAVAGSLGDPVLDERCRIIARQYLGDGTREPVIQAFDAQGNVLATAGPRQALPEFTVAVTEVFVQPVYPPPRLLVCGAGDDAIPLVAFAAGVGFRVAVADHRPAQVTAARFPAAQQLLAVQPHSLADAIELEPDTFAVVMSHHFQKDQEYLRVLLPSPVAYVGLLGPRDRTRRILENMATFDPVPAAALARLHSPVGLAIGADGPAEIAISILAEVLKVRSGV